MKEDVKEQARIESIKKAVTLALEHPDYSCKKIADIMKISSATVQRYLQSSEVVEYFSPEEVFKLKELLENRKRIKNNQEQIKQDIIKKLIELLTVHPEYTIQQLCDITGVPTSTIQRYLKDPIIAELFCSETFQNIQDLAQLRQMDGFRKGGLTSFKRNVPIKDEKGRFIGTVKYAGKDNRIEQKNVDILVIAAYFLQYRGVTLHELTALCNQDREGLKPFTVDYVYDCLTAPYISQILGEETIKEIRIQFMENSVQGHIKGAHITNEQRDRRLL